MENTAVIQNWKTLIKPNKLNIKSNQDKTITINSKCSLPTQCIDWGQNKRNINLFVEALKNILRDLNL